MRLNVWFASRKACRAHAVCFRGRSGKTGVSAFLFLCRALSTPASQETKIKKLNIVLARATRAALAGLAGVCGYCRARGRPRSQAIQHSSTHHASCCLLPAENCSCGL